MLKCIPFACALTLAAGVAVAAWADTCSTEQYYPRQYYGAWHYSDQYQYYYRPYYYKPTPSYSGYKHHYVVYYPSRAGHTYYYNPYSRHYWGRCSTAYPVGKQAYSTLALADQRGSLQDIPETAFPAPTAMPRVPEASDGALVQPPPDDLPEKNPLPR